MAGRGIRKDIEENERVIEEYPCQFEESTLGRVTIFASNDILQNGREEYFWI